MSGGGAVRAVRRTPRFDDYDEVYFADACEPLERAVRNGTIELTALAHGAYPGVALDRRMARGVQTVGFWNAARQQDWGLDWHRNDGVEVTYLDRGTAAFQTRNGAWSLQPGQFTITRPWQEHRVGDPCIRASRLYWAIIDVGVRRPHQDWHWPSWIGLTPSDLDRLTRLLQGNERPVWNADTGVSAVFETLRRLVGTPESPTLESELRVFTSALLLALLRALDREPVAPAAHLRSRRRAVCMFLDELEAHLDHPWTLDGMAAAADMGRSQFSRYCTELTNMAPVAYLASRRVARAMALLVERPDLSVTEVAFESGFQSSQYFATVFRKHTGRTARGFRANPS